MIANGVDLDTLAYNVSTRAGRLRTPARRGKNIDIPGDDGTVFTPGKRFTGQTIALPMWVLGADEEGNVPRNTRSREVFQDNLDRLLRLFTADTVELVDPMPDGTTRRIVGQVLDVIDPDAHAAGTRAQFSVSLVCAAAFWEDVDEVAAAKTGTGVWDVVAFQGATARMSDLTVRFEGACTNPQLTTPSGISIAYNAALTGGQWAQIDCSDWTVTAGGGLVASYAAVAHQGDARWFVLEPGDPTPRATFTQTAGTTGTAKLTGRRKYVTG